MSSWHVPTARCTRRSATRTTRSVLLRRGVDAGVVRDVEFALEQNELLVVYQPIIDLATGAPHSAEALIRRVLPDGALVPPAEFVPHVERTPLVRELTFLVVADALGSAQRGRRPATTSASRSTSRTACSTIRSSPTGWRRCCARTTSEPHRSRSRSSRQDQAPAPQVDEEVLGRFDALGVRLSLDDAGRAASFAALRVLPLDELKIDVGFVHGLGKSATDAALVRGMIDIGHALGLEVVAEGVETRDAWSVLAEWGCDYAQGFYVASPRRGGRARRLARRELARRRLAASATLQVSRAARRVRLPRSRRGRG